MAPGTVFRPTRWRILCSCGDVLLVSGGATRPLFEHKYPVEDEIILIPPQSPYCTTHQHHRPSQPAQPPPPMTLISVFWQVPNNPVVPTLHTARRRLVQCSSSIYCGPLREAGPTHRDSVRSDSSPFEQELQHPILDQTSIPISLLL